VATRIFLAVLGLRFGAALRDQLVRRAAV